MHSRAVTLLLKRHRPKMPRRGYYSENVKRQCVISRLKRFLVQAVALIGNRADAF